MAKHSFLGGLVTFSAAAAVAAGACYFFKDQIRETKTYQNLNEKYDVDTKVSKATSTAKTKASELKGKAVDLKNKAMDSIKKDDIEFEDDLDLDLDLNADVEISRDYVPLEDEDVAEEAKEAAEEVKEAAEEVKDAAAEAVENVVLD